uniref:C-type lectin domain-containing protein n=1 Tax=Seriola dumerili TaxID=41447 RepID=A0A3B4TSU1_SERDU
MKSYVEINSKYSAIIISFSSIFTGFVHFTFASNRLRVFRFIDQEKLWNVSLENCNSTNEAVEQWLNHTSGDGPFWIGLRQSRVFGFWIWCDKTVYYSHWKDGRQPEMPMSDNCGVIDKTDYTWRDENCWHEHPFICEEEISFMNKYIIPRRFP